MRYLYSLLAIFFAFNTLLFAQSDPEVEEVVVVGSQIKGASITDVLPVTVISTDDIEALGVSDGDELIDNLVEQGLNFFNEQEQASGGVNAARGDTGAYNIRSMGVGNTLTLLNGRRMVSVLPTPILLEVIQVLTTLEVWVLVTRLPFLMEEEW